MCFIKSLIDGKYPWQILEIILAREHINSYGWVCQKYVVDAKQNFLVLIKLYACQKGKPDSSIVFMGLSLL